MSETYGHFVPPDPNITHYSTGHNVQRATVNERFIMVESPQLGDFVIDGKRADGLYYDYLTTPDAYRSGGISQLCKDQSSGTIPNAYSMSRRWHCLDLFELVERFADRVGADDEQRLAYHLATDANDRAHTEFSHALEQGVQKWGGPENFHEIMWPHIAEVGGTTDVLRHHGVKFDDNIRIPGIAIPRFIEGNREDVNLDRFQYGVTELLLWFDHNGAPKEVREAMRTICDPGNLVITDEGGLAFADLETARLFAKGYLLLATEHWNDPINRVQLHLLIQATQRAILERRISWMDKVDKRETRQPSHYLYGIDQDIVEAMDTGPGRADDFMYAIKNALYPIAMQERQRFIDYKLGEYATFLLDERARNYPSEYLTPRRVEFGPPSSQVAVQMEASHESTPTSLRLPILESDAEGIQYRITPLKNRYVDPLVMTAVGPRPLSELDSNYAHLKEEQQQLQKMEVVVRLAFAGGFEKVFKDGVEANDREFDRLMQRSEMTTDQDRHIIEIAASRAKELGQQAGTLVLKTA